MSSRDLVFMKRAIELARNSLYLSDPNPRVGCVIVRGGEVLAEGWTQRAGDAHAEVHALRRLTQGCEGAEVFVTLEPCSHTGRTGPCTEALIQAGVRRVHAAMEDPNPQVGGAGIESLREAGIEVSVGLCAEEAMALNPGFLRRMRGGLPWVRLKLGASMDGRTATDTGQSKWITSAAAREDVHRWRARSSAVITGTGTILADDPLLNVRLEGVDVQPLRVVLDSTRRIAPTARIFGAGGSTLIVSTERQADGGRAPANGESLELPAEAGRVPLRAMLRALAARQCNEVLVEAGATLSGAFVRARLVDEFVLYLAPKLLGSLGRGMFDLGRIDALDEAVELQIIDAERIGSDLRVIARPIDERE